jgi:hypothetical protein
MQEKDQKETCILKYIILEMRIKHLHFFAETEDSQLAPKSKVYLATNPLKLTYSSSDKYILTFQIKTMIYVLTYCHI